MMMKCHNIICGLLVVFCGSVNIEGQGICRVRVLQVFECGGI